MHRWLALALLLASCARTTTTARARAFVWFEPRAGCVGPTGNTLPPSRATDTPSAAFARTRIDAAHAFAARRLPGGYANGPVPTASPAGRAIIWLKDFTARDAVLEQVIATPGLESYPRLPRDSVDVRLVGRLG